MEKNKKVIASLGKAAYTPRVVKDIIKKISEQDKKKVDHLNQEKKKYEGK
jgi:hypothetical protein